VVWDVVRGVTGLVGVGAGIGMSLGAIVILAMRAFSNPAPGITIYQPSFEPAAMLAILGFLLVVGLAAAFGPARRASRLSPLSALRQD
jgi:ABC-type antimicrobial peptide transport system permease subunit